MLSDDRIFNYHQGMLSDELRVRKFHEAIERVVKPDHSVLDLGTGTGLLAMLALKAGARRVYAIEQGDVYALAERLVKANGATDRLALVRGESTSTVLPERGDVLVGEIMGNAGLDEQILSSFIDARERLLKPGGVCCPSRVQVIVAPVEAQDLYAKKVGFWEREVCGLDYTSLRSYAVQQSYVARFEPRDLRADPQVVLDVDLQIAATPFAEGRATYQFAGGGLLHGLAVWFRAELCAGLWLSNSPDDPAGSWLHRFFPFARPLAVSTGDKLTTDISTYDGSVWRWRTTLAGRTETAEMDLCTFAGFPLDRRELNARSEGARVRPSYLGAAAAHVLGTMDGATPIGQLAARVRELYPGLFPTVRAARAFVGRLAAEYGDLGTGAPLE